VVAGLFIVFPYKKLFKPKKKQDKLQGESEEVSA
jgi:hypothetical protein